jgi:hypothetical protein
MKKDITELFVFIDDFTEAAELHLKQSMIATNSNSSNKPTRTTNMTLAEILTILLLYQQSPCKNFKYFYLSYLKLYKSEFPNLVSYERFVVLKSRVLIFLTMLLQWLVSLSKATGINFIDATSINICHNKRISRNKVFYGFAKLGKTTKGWFFGFKLHVVINDLRQIHGLKLTKVNVDDRTPVPDHVKHLKGLLFGDKGYIKSELFESLHAKGLKLVTSIKKGMKNLPMIIFEKQMLKKRSIIETVFDYLKNKFELEHSRHRSVMNFFVHILATLVAYSMKTTKPRVRYNNLIAQS